MRTTAGLLLDAGKVFRETPRHGRLWLGNTGTPLSWASAQVIVLSTEGRERDDMEPAHGAKGTTWTPRMVCVKRPRWAMEARLAR